jgi:RimJ/RimL family protein N-acetyltransferase
VTPAYSIHTSRLLIRCWALEDAPAVKDAIEANLEPMRPWMPWLAQYPVPIEAQVADLRGMRRKFDGDEDYCYGVFDRPSGEVVGGCGLHPRSGPDSRELGYWIRADRWGQGLATELAAALIRVGFEVLGVGRIDLRCEPANRASARVAEKLGFRHEATLRRRLGSASDGPLRDAMIYSLLAEELPGSPAENRARDLEAFDAIGTRIL